jgi:hypothetical protein
MEIKEPIETGADDFHSDDTPAVNIWALAGSDDEKEATADKPATPAEEDDELDKPSFLRRRFKLGSRKQGPKDSDKKEEEASKGSAGGQGENS